MKRKLTLTSLLLFCMMGQLMAENVTVQKAQTVVINFAKQQMGVESGDMSLVYTRSNTFYIFGYENVWIIVSANDAVSPILGYSTEGAFIVPKDDYDTIRGNNFWGQMKSYEDQIKYVVENNITATYDISSQWQDLTDDQGMRGTTTVVTPLLTTTWDQGWPYNEMCPSDAGGPGGHVWTGCVATAMAQILKYHNYPSQGLGSYGYQWGSYPYTGADFGATTYNWGNMPNSISTSNLDIATIMYQTAVSCHSMWGAGSTGVGYSSDSDPMTRAWTNYFKAAYSTIQYVESQYYTTTEWNNLIQAELTNNRPVYYRGDGVGSHAWVCGGVDASNMYHFNWGWGGQYNGYFALTAITPGSFNFTSNQHAIIGIKPNDGSTLITNTTWSGNVTKSTHIAVPDAITLTTSPGAVISFAENCKLQIWGKLTSIGTSNSYVRFTAVDTATGWRGIKWDNSHMDGTVMADNDTSKLVYTQVEYSDQHGIFCQYYGKVVIDHCKINNNYAYDGAGISVWYQAINISNSEIYNNHATSSGGGIFLSSIDNLPASISQNEIHNNLADIRGGGVRITCYENIIMKNNTIHHNQAVKGAGVGIWGGLTGPKVINNKFCNNSTIGDGKGGGLHIESCSPHVVNNLFANNTRGGLYITTNSNPLLLNNTISNNSHPYYGGGIRIMYNSNPTFKNTILYGNTAPDGSQISLETTDCDPYFDHCDVQGGVAGFGGSGAGSNYTIANYTNNIDLNPIYVSPSGGAGNGYDGLAANWQLQSSSPCINAGDTTGVGDLLPDLDLGDHPRLNGIIDMGAYEYCAPAQPDAISGNSALCAGSSQTYAVSPVSGIGYSWTVMTGWTITAGQGSNAIAAVAGSSSGLVMVTPVNGCGNGAPQTLAVTVHDLPAIPSAIEGTPNPCVGTTQTYAVVGVTATNYAWTVPINWTIVAGQGSHAVTVVAGDGAGMITVTPSNNCGTGPVRQLAVASQDIPLPATAIEGSTGVCRAETAVIYTTPVIQNASTYLWTLPQGASGSSSSNSITVNFGANAFSGEISVKGMNACGEGQAASLFVQVNEVPDQTGEIVGNTNPCEGYTGIYSVIQTEAVTYTWTVPAGATIINGQGSHAIVVNMGTSSGNIIVTPANLCGNGLESSLFITVNHPPIDTPSQASGPETVNSFNTATSLYTTNAVANTNDYLWDLYPIDAGVLSSGNDTSVTVTWNTGFTGNCALVVKAVNNCGESPFSIPLIIYVDYLTSLYEVNTSQIQVYPNPAKGSFVIESTSTITEVKLYDLSGRCLFVPATENQAVITLDLNLAEGLYFVHVCVDNEWVVKKISIVR